MLVWELIKQLGTLPDDLEVIYMDDSEYEEVMVAKKIDIGDHKPFILLT